MKVFITGVAGFVGSHLAEFALAEGAEVFALDREGVNLENIDGIKQNIKYFCCNIQKEVDKLSSIIKESEPDWVFHLAALREGEELFQVNVKGSMNLLNSLLFHRPSARVLFVGSSAQYGMVYKEENPVREENPFRPLDLYGISKCAQEMVAQMYALNHGMDIVRVRTFNIIGARQSAAFACSSFAKQIACIEKGLQPPIIHVGNLSSCRDFLDVRDVVRAYWLLLQKGKRGEVYNVCSEKAWSMEKILEFLLSLSPEKERIKIKKQKERMRVGDVPLQIGDASKIRKECGWCATVKVEESLEDLLNFWRRKEVLDGVGR